MSNTHISNRARASIPAYHFVPSKPWRDAKVARWYSHYDRDIWYDGRTFKKYGLWEGHPRDDVPRHGYLRNRRKRRPVSEIGRIVGSHVLCGGCGDRCPFPVEGRPDTGLWRHLWEWRNLCKAGFRDSRAYGWVCPRCAPYVQCRKPW